MGKVDNEKRTRICRVKSSVQLIVLSSSISFPIPLFQCYKKVLETFPLNYIHLLNIILNLFWMEGIGVVNRWMKTNPVLNFKQKLFHFTFIPFHHSPSFPLFLCRLNSDDGIRKGRKGNSFIFLFRSFQADVVSNTGSHLCINFAPHNMHGLLFQNVHCHPCLFFFSLSLFTFHPPIFTLVWNRQEKMKGKHLRNSGIKIGIHTLGQQEVLHWKDSATVENSWRKNYFLVKT